MMNLFIFYPQIHKACTYCCDVMGRSYQERATKFSFGCLVLYKVSKAKYGLLTINQRHHERKQSDTHRMPDNWATQPAWFQYPASLAFKRGNTCHSSFTWQWPLHVQNSMDTVQRRSCRCHWKLILLCRRCYNHYFCRCSCCNHICMVTTVLH